jgi:hypothetical protein
MILPVEDDLARARAGCLVGLAARPVGLRSGRWSCGCRVLGPRGQEEPVEGALGPFAVEERRSRSLADERRRPSRWTAMRTAVARQVRPIVARWKARVLSAELHVVDDRALAQDDLVDRVGEVVALGEPVPGRVPAGICASETAGSGP